MPNLRSIYKTARCGDLPPERKCNTCGETKPREEMIVQHRNEKNGDTYYYFRPKCKDCHNKKERGSRRDYKTKYLRKWRQKNAKLNESYWRNDESREAARVRAANFTQEQKAAIAIQRRLRSKGEFVTIAEARELLEKYGRCYPTRYGLTKRGLDRCEQIRSRLRIMGRKRTGSFGYRMMTNFEIRIMVYEESEEEPTYLIPPDQQPVPYQKAAERLRNWQRNQRKAEVSI